MSEWRCLDWLPGFEISEFGEVRHTGPIKPGQRAGQRLTGHWKAARYGARYRTHYLNGHHYYSHRLVCEAFHGAPPHRSSVARHLDGDSENNHYLNLAWGTQAENSHDALRHGTIARGSRSGVSKLTEAQVEEIRERLLAGETQASIAEVFGCCKQNIGRIARAEQWAHVSSEPIRSRAANGAKLFCKHGHPFDDENTRLDKRGRRSCRACGRNAARVFREKRAELGLPEAEALR